jgi:membrane-associated phospholipid phosphatase
VSDPSTAGPRPWRRALAWLAFLGPFFFATYGLATWATAQRTGVPSIVFEWERSIPFWPWTIVPYWIIDALYAASLFACSTPRELDTHAKRLLTAQVVAIAVFLAAPLRFSFEPPPVDGVAGAMFGMLRSFDQPFNQLPSLHLALAVILAALFTRKATGIARIGVVTGFVVIGLSVLTTWQHHFIDVPTGVLLGALCVWAWPLEGEGDGRPVGSLWHLTRDPGRARLALGYAGRRNACRCACRRRRRGARCGRFGSPCRSCWSRSRTRPGCRRIPEGAGRSPVARGAMALRPLPCGRVGQLACVDAQRRPSRWRSRTACSSDACRRRGSWPDRRSSRSST